MRRGSANTKGRVSTFRDWLAVSLAMEVVGLCWLLFAVQAGELMVDNKKRALASCATDRSIHVAWPGKRPGAAALPRQSNASHIRKLQLQND